MPEDGMGGDEGDTRPRPDPTELTAKMGREVEGRARDFTEHEIQHLRELVFAELASVRRELGLLLDAAKEAIGKAELASDERFKQIDQWREQTADRERELSEELSRRFSTLVRSDTAESEFKRLRENADAQFGELRRSLMDLTEKVNRLA